MKFQKYKDFDLMTKDAHLQSTWQDKNVGKIIAYTVWSKKRGGKLIKRFSKNQKSNHLNNSSLFLH